MAAVSAQTVLSNSSPTILPTLDPAPLAQWRARARDTAPNFVRELIDEFLTDAATQLAILERATAAGDAATCQFVAHRLRGSSKAIGGFQLASLFEEMERLAKDSAAAQLARQFAGIQAEYDRLELALNLERAAGQGAEALAAASAEAAGQAPGSIPSHHSGPGISGV